MDARRARDVADRERLDRDLNLDRADAPPHLAPLDNLDDFKVADGDPDIRGWDVCGADRKKVGEVHDLIVDTGAMMVRYMDVELDRKATGTSDTRHILVPIGCASLDDDRDQVLVPGLNASGIGTIPEYRHGAITRDFEQSVRGCYGNVGATAGATAATGASFYDSEQFDESRFWGSRRRGREGQKYLTLSEEELAVGKRRVKAGEVEVHKTVDTEHVKRQVPVSHEEVTVERRPATGMDANARIGEDEIRVPVMEEQIVTEKRVVPKEEVVISKKAVTENKTVEGDVRREHVDIDKEGDVRRDRR